MSLIRSDVSAALKNLEVIPLLFLNTFSCDGLTTIALHPSLILDSKISENELERLSEMIVYYDYRNYDKTNVENEIKDKRKKLYSKILNFIKTDT